MLNKLSRTPRHMLVLFTCMVNVLSSMAGTLIWSVTLRDAPTSTVPAAPLFPLVITILIAIPLSALMSKQPVKPYADLIQATKAISKGDYSVRVEENGEGEIGELLRSFNQMTAELAGTELMRNDFVNMFSHEFKTPIVSIRGFARRLRQDRLSEQQRRDYLDYIVHESERLADLATNILLLSKYENQQIVAERRAYELDEQIRRCVLLLETQWEAKQLTFDMELGPLVYEGNREMLDHVWLNLVGNAIKFSPPNGTIHISAAQQIGCLEICIRDEGIGMSPEIMEHIFDKFYQGDRSHACAGNGLGLSLVRRIVDLCGGQITVDSTEGVGSSFCIILPCHFSHAPAPTGYASPCGWLSH